MMIFKTLGLFAALAIFNSSGALAATQSQAGATPDRDLRLTGAITAITERVVEVKTSRATVLIPKDLVPKDQIKSSGVVDIHMTKAQLDRVKVK